MLDIATTVTLLLTLIGLCTLAYQYRVVTVKLAQLRKENAELKQQLAIFATVNELRGGDDDDSSDMFVPQPPPPPVQPQCRYTA